MDKIQEKHIYEYQSIAESESAQVKVIQVHEYKNRIRVEVSRDLIHCINPFRVNSIDLK